MHEIQKFILVQLIGIEAAKYSDLKPASMEGSKFTYHLKQLIDNDLVRYSEKSKRYTLSNDGRMLADRFDTQLLEEAIQPTIVVLATVERQPNEWLLAQRHVHPAYNKKGFLHLHVVLGETLVEQANNSLRELTGIHSDLQYRGHAYVTQYTDSQPESVVMVHFLSGKYERGELANTVDEYTFKWIKDPDWTDKSYIPSCGDLLSLAQNSRQFFAELTYHL